MMMKIDNDGDDDGCQNKNKKTTKFQKEFDIGLNLHVRFVA